MLDSPSTTPDIAPGIADDLAERLERLLALSPAQTMGVGEATLKMTVLACGTCGVAHALPVELLLSITKAAGQVFCPNGHPLRLDDSPIAPRDLITMHVKALVELRQRTAELNRIKLQLARAEKTAIVPIDAEEYKRRLHLMSSRAARVDGQLICSLCGKPYRKPFGFREHLRRVHADEVRMMPQSFFD